MSQPVFPTVAPVAFSAVAPAAFPNSPFRTQGLCVDSKFANICL
jgi:hypothetical protein